jgi:hypothetical protein
MERMKMVEKADLERLRQYTLNSQWLLENMDKLREKLPDRYVAVCEGGNRVIDAPSRNELLDKLAMSGTDAGNCAIDFVSREVYALIV